MKKPWSKLIVASTGKVLWAVLLMTFVFSPAGAQQGGKAYISSQDGTKVYVLDLQKNAFVKTINIFIPGSQARSLPPNINDILAVGNRLFLSVPGSEISASGVNEIKVIDSRTDTVAASVKTDLTPSGLHFYRGNIYVVNRFGNTIQEIDPSTLKISRAIPFTNPKPGAMGNPMSLEIVNEKIYLTFPGTGFSPGGVQILDLKDGAVLKFIDFSQFGNQGPLAIMRVAENKIYLGGNQAVGVLDTTTDTITKTIPIVSRPGGSNVQGFAVVGGKVYAASGVSMINVIDAAKDAAIGQIDIGFHSYASHLKVGIAAYEGKVYVADAGRGIKVIDTTMDRVVTSVNSDAPFGPVAIVPPSGR